MPRLTEVQLDYARLIEDDCPEGWSIRTWYEVIPGGLDVSYYVGVTNEQGQRVGYYCIDPYGNTEATWLPK
jgi:hypothetical protein